MNKSENRFCVYTHTRPDKDVIFYVGIGSLQRSRSKKGRNQYWRKIVNKNNGHFKVDIIGEDLSWSFCCEVEIGLIKSYGRVDNGTGILSNMTDGGDGVINPSEETRRKIGIAQKGKKISPENIAKLKLFNKGRKCSDETKGKLRWAANNRSMEYRLKMSNTKKGHKYSDEIRLRNKIAQIRRLGCLIEQVCPINGSVINTFLAQKIASQTTGINQECISGAISGKYRQAGGFLWRRSYDLTKLDQLIAQL